MPKRDLSPESRERNQRPFQQQKSVSEIIDPLRNCQCHTAPSNNGEESNADCETSVRPDQSAPATDVADGYHEDCTDVDGLRDVTEATGKVVKSTVLRPQLLEEGIPGNNPPEEAVERIVLMGMHIKFKNGSGQMVTVVEPGKLAEQAGVKEGDVIIAIGETDVTKTELNEVLDIFNTIANTFSMAVIRTLSPEEGTDIPIPVKHIIDVHINEDQVDGIKPDERPDQLWLTSTRNGYISHKANQNATRYYLKASDGAIHMNNEKEVNNAQYHFKLNTYAPQCNDNKKNPCDPCTVCNASCNKVVEIKTDTHQIMLGKTDDLMGNDGGYTADFNRFFLLHGGWQPNNYAFECIENSTKGFLAVDNNVLKLDSFTGDVKHIPSKFRFDFEVLT